MQVQIPLSELEFAREVDRLGAQGLSQDAIASHFRNPDGTPMTRFQVRHRLDRSHLAWSAESRVRFDIDNRRLEEAVADGVLAPLASDAPADKPEPSPAAA